MGFLTGTTSGHSLIESQRCSILGRTIDLTSMVWFVGVCFGAQRHNKGSLEGHVGAKASSQRAMSVVPIVTAKIAHLDAKVWLNSRQAWDQVIDKMRALDAVEWLVVDDLRQQHVLEALA